MNKKLLTLAVAAAMVAPTAAMADAILYGKLHASIDWANVNAIGSDYLGWGLNGGGRIPGEGRASRIGVKGSEDLGNGLKAIYQVELGVQLAEENSKYGNPKSAGNLASGADNTVYMRNTFVGLASDWGTLVIGRNDTPMKTSTAKLDLFADTMADNNSTLGFNDVRADNAVAYISPNLSGFQLAGAVVASGGSTAGFGYNNNADTIGDAYSIAGIYSNGPFYASVAYESLGNELYMDTATSDAGEGAFGYVGEDYTKWRVGLGLLNWNGFSLTGLYEEQDFGSTNAVLNGRTLWQVQAGYAFGNEMIKAMYGQGERDAVVSDTTWDEGYQTWAIAFDHNFSKRTKAYVVYTEVDDDFTADNLSWGGVSVGMSHDF